MQFDVVVMNPPYQGQIKGKEGRNNLLWPDFVRLSLQLSKEYVCNVHPALWRKPEYPLFKELITKNMIYLRMYSNKAAKRLFGADTHIDWYILQMTNYNGITTIVDERKVSSQVDIASIPFVPGSNIQYIMGLVGTPTLNVLYSTAYHNQSEGVSEERTEEFCFPVVHTITKNGPKIYYSNTRQKGIFGVKPKIIVSTGRHIYTVIDLDGSMGTTEGCFSIVVDDVEEALNVDMALNSAKFKEKVIKETKWSNFRIDYKFFRHLKRNFWVDF